MADKELGESYRRWIMDQARDDLTVSRTDADHITLATDKAQAQVTFYQFEDDEPEIVELRIQLLARTCEDVFFLHFELEDEARAEELFSEMLEVLDRQNEHETTHVLLCCTTGMTTTMFAAKLGEAAKAMSLDFEFDALSFDKAVEQGTDYAAILLAPQVGYRRKEVIEAYPDKVVFEIPAKFFGSYDAASVLHLLLGTMDEVSGVGRDLAPDTKIERDIPNDKRILVMSVVNRPKGSRIGYRIFSHGRVVLDGKVYKRHFHYKDLEDVSAGLRMMGYKTTDMDMVGIALPGVSHEGSMHLHNGETMEDGVDLADHLEEVMGVPVLIENNANAAAVGCYVTQNEYESIVLYTQRTGMIVGGMGTIVNGRLVRGRAGAAGELGPVSRHMKTSKKSKELCWSPEGLCKIASEMLLCSICTVAPEAAYVAIAMIPDMEPLREELAQVTPKEYMPELVAVLDYHERIMIGTLALCLNLLRK